MQKGGGSSRSGNALVSNGMPRSLFQRMFEQSLPQINILTKTQVIPRSEPPTHARNQSSIIPNRARRGVPSNSSRQSQHNPAVLTPIGITPRKQEQPTHPRLKALRRRMLLKNPRMVINDRPSIIYKSEITLVEPTSTNDLALNTYIQHDSTVTEQEVDPPPSKQESKETVVPWTRTQYRRLPIAYEGDSQKWLRKIFGQKDYEDSYEDINKQLLRNEQLYKSKGFNLKMEKEWRY